MKFGYEYYIKKEAEIKKYQEGIFRHYWMKYLTEFDLYVNIVRWEVKGQGMLDTAAEAGINS